MPWLKRYTPLKRSTKPIRKDARTEGEKKLDADWRMRVLAKWHHRCAFESTGTTTTHDVGQCYGPLDYHHIKGKATKALRYDPDNGIALCRAHHQWVHAQPRQAKEVMG